ncbi:MAG: hypothetical protein EOO50_15395 [Flavobacterium sp.]|uniref:aspartyl protease family protein n=1 Tax=Flavobacterium sp. TaxID=239 RepID=UPI0011FB71F1|nr:aspartyl protease family protein [Flavobacterium sp.]RZJ64507.1 MAG: hypothetical protein EOO50_15395 [Flavobacterium sp.]
MKDFLLFAFSVFSTLGFCQTKDEIKKSTKNRDTYLFAVKAEPKKFDETIPSEYVTDEILIPVEINGKTYTFLFDTGAITVLSDDIVKQMGLQPVTSNRFIDSAGNTTDENFYMVPEIKLGSVAFKNVGVGSFDLDTFSRLLCRPIDGIFGSNIMRVCNWEIDYEKPSLRFSSDKIALPDANSVPFTQNFSGSPDVIITTGGFNFRTSVDTGNNGSLDIPNSLFEKSRLKNVPRIAKSRGKGFYSLLGNAEQDEHTVMADSVYIGNVLLQRRIRVSPSPMYLLGNDFLSPFGRFVINYRKGELLLPKRQKELPPENTFGFTPLRENTKTVVGVIWENSDAQKSGLELDDEIISLDGTVLSGLSDMDWCEFRQNLIKNEKLKVVVRKPDGREISVELDKYDLFK